MRCFRLEKHRSLIDLLNNNTKKILEVGKYTKNELKTLIEDITNAERSRRAILDKVEEHMAKQRADSVMNYEDFDYKQRIKDLGSPLESNKEKEE